MIHELLFALKLKKAAEKGRPLIMAVYPDATFGLYLPDRVFGDTVEYYDPRRGETRTIVPRHLIAHGKLRVAIIPSGFLESIGYEGLALLALPPDARREVQHKLAEKLGELAETNPELAKAICEDLGIKVLPLYSSEDLRKQEVLREIETLTKAGYLSLADAVKQAQARIESSLITAAHVATLLKRSGLLDAPAIELCSALERATEIFHVRPEEVLFAERLRANARIEEVIGRSAYFRKPRLAIKRLLAIAAIVIVIIFLLVFVLPALMGGLGGAARQVIVP